MWCFSFVTSPIILLMPRLIYSVIIDWERVWMNRTLKRLLKKPVKPLILIKWRKCKKMFIHKSRRLVHPWMKFFYRMTKWWMILLDYLHKKALCLAEVGLVWLLVGPVHLLIILVSFQPFLFIIKISSLLVWFMLSTIHIHGRANKCTLFLFRLDTVF